MHGMRTGRWHRGPTGRVPDTVDGTTQHSGCTTGRWASPITIDCMRPIMFWHLWILSGSHRTLACGEFDLGTIGSGQEGVEPAREGPIGGKGYFQTVETRGCPGAIGRW
jgi:hypothetical protein